MLGRNLSKTIIFLASKKTRKSIDQQKMFALRKILENHSKSIPKASQKALQNPLFLNCLRWLLLAWIYFKLINPNLPSIKKLYNLVRPATNQLRIKTLQNSVASAEADFCLRLNIKPLKVFFKFLKYEKRFCAAKFKTRPFNFWASGFRLLILEFI